MDPKSLAIEVFDKGSHNEIIPYGFEFSEWEEKARNALSANSFGYVLSLIHI